MFTHHTLVRSALSFLVAIGILAAPIQASAIFVPTWDPNTQSLSVKEYALDTAVKAVVKILLQQVVQSLTNWALNGYNGNPSFTLNPKDLLSRVKNETGNNYIVELGNADLCIPYRNRSLQSIARLNTRIDEITRHDQGQTFRITACELDDLITSGNIQNYFTQGGYTTEGGDAAFLQLLFSRKDNPYEIEEVVKDELKRRASENQRESIEETRRGQGYEDYKECVQQGAAGCLRYEVKTPGFNVGEAVQKSVGQSFDEIASADEISELVIGFITAFLNQAIGPQGLR